MPVAFVVVVVVVVVAVFEQEEIISEVGQLASVGFVLMTDEEADKVEVTVF